MRFALIDFETASPCDLKKSGAWVYAEHPCTEILCLGYTIDGASPVVLTPAEIAKRIGELWDAAHDPEVIFVAHNCSFEKSIWRNLMVHDFGWPDIPNERWHDSMAVCAMKGLPLKLERAALALRLANQKDTGGTKATVALSKTNKKGYYDRSAEKLQRVYDYNAQDVRAELELHRAVRGLGPGERKVWLLDQRVNERGVRLDMDLVAAMQDVCDQAAKPLREEFAKLTGGLAPTQDKQFKEWLVKQGCPFPRDAEGNLKISLAKDDVAKMLGEKPDDEEDTLADTEDDYRREDPQQPLPFAYRRPLEIRSILGSASVKKLAAMQACCGSDGRAHGLLQYHGAGPGRWAGRLLQPQNFPRPTLKVITGFKPDGTEITDGHDPDQLVEAIMTRDAEFVRVMFGDPIKAVASGLRHTIVASEGNTLEVGDFSKIECVIVLCIAGAWEKAHKVILKGSAVYTDMASGIFGRPITKHDLAEYTIGKNVVLGCGFQMGKQKFFKRYCEPLGLPMEFAEKGVNGYREDFAPEVPPLWRALEDAAVATVWNRQAYEAYGIQYRLEDGWLTCRLPSGRKLWYYDPRPVRKAMPWDKNDIRPGFEYSAWKMGRWQRRAAYGGLLTENVVQATARDMLVNALFNCEREGHNTVLTIHDEIVNDVSEWLASADRLNELMCDQPEYIKALRIPTASECWTGARYKK